jgi:Domain of unknown function (DUF4214)
MQDIGTLDGTMSTAVAVSGSLIAGSVGSFGTEHALAAYVEPTTATERYVQRVYSDLLGRSPDAGGAAYWADLVDSGVSRSTVAWTIVSGSAVAGAITWSAEAIGSRVNGYYQALLGRNADASGCNYWVYLIGHGHRDEESVALLVGSDEYLRRV